MPFASASAFASRFYWRLYQRFINPEIPTGGIDVFGCTRMIAARIVAFPETRTSLIGLLYWMGFRRRTFPYHRQPRHSGKSAWTFRRKLRYLFDSIYAFTDLPIVPLWYNGAWAQFSAANWTGWPGSGDKQGHNFPVTWNGYWNMTAILMLTQLTPVKKS